MGCCGDREKGPTKESQKWEYITLNDFKSTSAWNMPAYVWLWILFISTIVIYAVDTFTAVNLIVFNKWSSQVKPAIPFDYSKWIFAGCILFSWALWGFEWFRAIRVINRGGVAESYMDPLAVSLQSMRSKGWNRFLVFAELTKSKKGMDLVAFFSYFAFKGAIRIVLAEGPRQVINTLTLIAVIKADFVEKTDGHQSGIGLFWSNLGQMWSQDKQQVVIIFSMMYSLFIWVISIICLASAAIMYIVFLWHYIPSQDGGLSSFCKRKVDKRLEKIVESKVKAAIEEEERKKRKAEEKDWKAAQKAEKKGRPMDGAAPIAPGIARQPTLPKLDTFDDKDDDSMDNYPLRRTDTAGSVATLPPYASRPGTRNEHRPPLPNYSSERPPPVRSATNGSQWTTASYESDAPLLANAAQNGESLPVRPPTAFSRQDSNASFGRQDSFGRPPMPRAMTPGSQRSLFAERWLQRRTVPIAEIRESFGRPMQTESPVAMTPIDRVGAPSRAGTATSFDRPGTTAPYNRAATATPYDRAGTATPYSRAGTATPLDRNGAATPFDRSATSVSRQPTAASNYSFSKPLPLPKSTQSLNRSYTTSTTSQAESNSYEMKPNPYTSKASTSDTPSTYTAFNPNRTASPAPAPQRSNTATSQDYFSHKPAPAPAAASSQNLAAHEVDSRASGGYLEDIVNDYGDSHTPAAESPSAVHQPGWHPRY
ncbi:hypothetical protein AMS68_007549 [Peltaster fructicola]|uniref:Vacuolar membrane protein n=1 Tax=Peltaster fructicola TaxID=286661 RepID=A0A6H0Y4S2_9PEZI|nr:hypothetical protein AMS68_007549 [Peltaster fructicola]